MSKLLHTKARPEGGWSLPVDTTVTRDLVDRYAAVEGIIDMAAVILFVRQANGTVQKQALPLTDGYEPYAVAVFSAGSLMGDVCVVFPYCTDTACEDRSMMDRAVSVHTMGEVPDSLVDRVIARLIEAMPTVVLAPAPTPEEIAVL